MRRSFLVLALAASTLTSLSFAEGKQTIKGTVTDAMCGAHHMMKDASAAKCTRECVKQGSTFALVSGDKLYTLKGDKAKFDSLAGQNVTVQGNVTGTTIDVDSIMASK